MATVLLLHNVFCPKPHLRVKSVFRPLTAPCPHLSVRSISPNYVLKPLPSFVVNADLACIGTPMKPVLAGLVLAVLLLNSPHDALAASGGRMGGSSFSSGSRSSSSSSSRYSSPSRSSSSSYSSPSLSSSSSYSSSKSSSDPSESNKLSYSESSPAPTPGAVTSEAKTGGGFNFFLIGFVAVALLCWYSVWKDYQREIQETSIIKLQVGLLGMARSFQKDLDEIAKVADTSTTKGLSYILTETTLALLRHPDTCISGYSYVDVKRSIEDGEKRFNMLSIEERGKFDEETLVNVNNIKRQSTSTRRSKGLNNEYIVITILVAAEGVHKLPVINGSADLKVALQKLGSIPANKTLAVEVLWTPQDENDTLTERELLEDYPLLRPL